MNAQQPLDGGAEGEPVRESLPDTIARLFMILVFALIIWGVFRGFLGFFQNPVWLIVFAAAFWLVVSTLSWIFRRESTRFWVAAGVVLFLCLLQPTASIADSPLSTTPYAWLNNLLSGLITLLPSAAVLLGAVLLHLGLLHWGEQPKASKYRRAVVVIFAVFTLLLARTIHNIYWLMVWDSATDPLDFIWLFMPLLAVILSSVFLGYTLPRRYRLASAYGLVVFGLMIAATIGAKSVGFRERTAARAQRVTQAIEAFQAREGRYPASLSQLVPRYMLAIPGPVIFYGQGWCYDAAAKGASGDAGAAADYYRLAYADREHWSSPELFAHIVAVKGEIPGELEACDQQIAGLLSMRYDYVRVNDR